VERVERKCPDCGILIKEGICPVCGYVFDVHEGHDTCPDCGFDGNETEFIFNQRTIT